MSSNGLKLHVVQIFILLSYDLLLKIDLLKIINKTAERNHN